MSDEPRLKVKHGGKVLGPMSTLEVADLMAEGKIAESDLVSDGGPWVTFEAYVSGHSEPDVSSVTPADVESLFAGEFAIEFDASGAAKGAAAGTTKASAGRPAASRPAPPSKSKAALDDDEIVDLLEADDDDSDVVDLDLADDEEASPKGKSSPGAAKAPPGKPAAAGSKPPAGAAKPTAKPPAPSVPGKPSLRPMPLPYSMKGGPGKAPPPLMEAEDDIDVMELLSDDPKPAKPKTASPKGPAATTGSTKGSPPPSTASKQTTAGGTTSKAGARPAPVSGKLPEVPPSPAGKKGAQPLNEAHSPSLPPGFRPMFNGRNFSGWEFFPIEDWTSGRADCWKVEGGIIKFDGTARRPHLLSIPEFIDFELFVGWRALKPDWQGGILLRSDSAPSGTRCFISLGAKDAGKLCGVGTSGSKAAPGIQKPVGEWNVWRIVAVGERIGLWCNQECAWSEASLNRPKGKIGLRADGSPLEFKFLHVRELTKK